MSTLELSLPPFTDNHTYGRTPRGQQFLKREAREWLEDVRWQAKARGFTPKSGEEYRVHIVIRLVPGDRREIQNMTKLLLDAIFTAQLDRQIVHLCIDRDYPGGKYLEGMTIEWETEVVRR